MRDGMKKTQITIESMQNRHMLPIDEVDKKLKNSYFLHFYAKIRKFLPFLKSCFRSELNMASFLLSS